MMDESKQVENPQNPTKEEILDPADLSPPPVVEAQDSPDEIEVDGVIDSPLPEIPNDPPLSPAAETDPAEMAQAAFLAEVLASKDAELTTLKQSHDEVKAQYQRLGADFDNFRKRTQKEKSELEEQVKCKTIQELLPVVDNFERARSQIKPQTEGEMNIHKSYQSVYKQLVDCLKRVGVSPMRAEGKEFDPNLHEAVMREPTAAYPEGTVTEELVRGYLINDRVLRHAMVKVASAPEDPEPAIEEEEPASESSET